MDRIQIYIPGIDTWPGSAKNWTGRAVTHTHCYTEYRAEKVEYFAGPIDRAFGQKKRAEKLARTLDYYDRYQKRVLVGHSNGSDVITTMLRDFPCVPRLDAVHLVCGATAADFDKNGLNQELLRGHVGQVFVYVAGKDLALRLASLRLARMLGYGTLGLHGPVNVNAQVQSRVTIIDSGAWSGYGHSDCWRDDQFPDTMVNFLKP